MTKRLLSLAAAALVAQASIAQEVVSYTQDSVYTTELVNPSKYTVETNKFWDNWFIGFGVGGQSYFGDHNKQVRYKDYFKDRISLVGQINVGKWFTPGLGLRANISGYEAKGISGWTGHTLAHPNVNYGNYQGFIDGDKVYTGVNVGYPLKKTLIKYFNVEVDAMFDLFNLFGGYKPRFWSLIPYGGLGFAWTTNKAINGEKSHEVTANVGLINRFRLSSAFDLNLDVRGVYVNDRFDQQVGGRWGEGILQATVGLAYNFNRRDWEKAVSTTLRVNEGLLNSLQNNLREAEQANVDLRKQLEDALNRKVDRDNVVAMPLLVTFTIDKWKLSNKDRVNLGFLAEVLKANPNMVYQVVGYADKGTGSVKRNIFLAQKRAEVVYDCLVNEFGVSESQLRKDSKGGVDNLYYNDPRVTRAVLSQLVQE